MLKDKRKTKQNINKETMFINLMKQKMAEKGKYQNLELLKRKTELILRIKNTNHQVVNSDILTNFTNVKKGNIKITAETAEFELEKMYKELLVLKDNIIADFKHFSEATISNYFRSPSLSHINIDNLSFNWLANNTLELSAKTYDNEYTEELLLDLSKELRSYSHETLTESELIENHISALEKLVEEADSETILEYNLEKVNYEYILKSKGSENPKFTTYFRFKDYEFKNEGVSDKSFLDTDNEARKAFSNDIIDICEYLNDVLLTMDTNISTFKVKLGALGLNTEGADIIIKKGTKGFKMINTTDIDKDYVLVFKTNDYQDVEFNLFDIKNLKWIINDLKRVDFGVNESEEDNLFNY
ncbi:hypothetical protein ACNZ6T_002734 [Enterococcus faecium]|jgi:hypothetical protein|uniref:hypothetical protein n=1 Tax=Enterococcus faecium TaxID=1352 RepID=UPI002DB8C3F9|nr:hypothetical protein [Enterococcus faecium]MEB7478201.1 hypothetical protein [Enterococcus faecium]MEB8314831.1 hypothetical protein [Enterococcus faecium]MEB8450739.1 hypothetical protein [Enterococcus faecium]